MSGEKRKKKQTEAAKREAHVVIRQIFSMVWGTETQPNIRLTSQCNHKANVHHPDSICWTHRHTHSLIHAYSSDMWSCSSVLIAQSHWGCCSESENAQPRRRLGKNWGITSEMPIKAATHTYKNIWVYLWYRCGESGHLVFGLRSKWVTWSFLSQTKSTRRKLWQANAAQWVQGKHAHSSFCVFCHHLHTEESHYFEVLCWLVWNMLFPRKAT